MAKEKQSKVRKREEVRKRYVKHHMAVRDDSGKFLGTLECVQKMKFAEDHFINA